MNKIKFIKYLILNLIVAFSLVTFASDEVYAAKVYDSSGNSSVEVTFNGLDGIGGTAGLSVVEGFSIKLDGDISFSNMSDGDYCEISVYSSGLNVSVVITKAEGVLDLQIVSCSCLYGFEFSEEYDDIVVNGNGFSMNTTDMSTMSWPYETVKDMTVCVEYASYIDYVDFYSEYIEFNIDAPEVEYVPTLESSIKKGGVSFYSDNGVKPTVESREKTISATYENLTTKINAIDIFLYDQSVNDMYFSVDSTGIYTISVYSGGEEIKYLLKNAFEESVRLAARLSTGIEPIIETPPPTGQTFEIDVVLVEGTRYVVRVPATEIPVTVNVTPNYISSSAIVATNIFSHVVSADWSQLRESDIRYHMYDYLYTLDYVGTSGIDTFEFSEDQIVEYILAGDKSEEEALQNASWIERIFTQLLVSVGTIFIDIVEWAIGSSDELSIDSILFNRFGQTVVDLTPLGGIPLTQSSTGKGIFYQSEIVNIINIIFKALRVLAIAIYIVLLLFIGVKILLSVGSKDQSKYTKYIQYWLTGIVILFIFPYFIPIIPAMNNAFVELMEDRAIKFNGGYDIKTILARLGGDAALLGEDAEIEAIRDEIDERIEELEEMIQNAPQTREEAQANIAGKIDNIVNNRLVGLDKLLVYKNELNKEINKVITYIDENFDDFDESEYERLKRNVYGTLNGIFSENSIENHELKLVGIPDVVISRPKINDQIKGLLQYVQSNAYTWNSSNQNFVYNMMGTIANTMLREGLGTYYSQVESAINEMKDTRLDMADRHKNELDTLFSNYKDAVLQEEIDDLTDMRNSIAMDTMTTLKIYAKDTGRIVYAIAWLILVYQMFAILFMYYKRLLVIIILIAIFPIVMAFYVIDKISDGQSQSLQNWLKEFIANITVQTLHCAMYLLIVNVAIDVCSANPAKYWFFLILSVCTLFPAERILRGVLGLQASTLGELKNNVTGTIAGGAAVAKTAVNLKRGYDDIKSGEAEKRKEKEEKKKKDEREKKENAKKERKRIRHDSRTIRQEKRQKEIDNRQRRLADGTASSWDKLSDASSKKMEKLGNSKIGKFAKSVASSKATQTALKLGKGTIKGGKGIIKGGKYVLNSKAVRTAAGIAKTGFGLAKKGYGLTMGAMEGIETFSKGEGAMAGIYTARNVAHDTGGFENQPKVGKATKSAKAKKTITAAQRYPSRYQNGRKVAGGSAPTSGNTRGGSSNANSVRVSNQVRTNLRVHQNGNMPDSNDSHGSS